MDPSNWDPPRFHLPKYEWWEISELTTVGSIVNRIQPAKDMDRGKYGQIVYNIAGGDKHEWFSIDPSDGKDERVFSSLFICFSNTRKF